jgi:hypothetical protein
MKHYEGSIPQSNKMIILMTNGIGKTHPFPYLEQLDGVLELNHCQFRLVHFNILLLHPSYPK